jgi:putative transposase
MTDRGLSLRQACRAVDLPLSSYYYRPREKEGDAVIGDKLMGYARRHQSWGFWMIFDNLRMHGYEWNHKRIYRIYKEMGLHMRQRPKERLPRREKEPIVQPLFPNLSWSMDFMHDGLIGGKQMRSFNVIDDFNRESLNITLDTSISSQRVIRELEWLIEWRGEPERIRVDNGPEFIAEALKKWCRDHGIDLIFIQPGKPAQNALIERFNRTFREEVLDLFLFRDLEEARRVAEAWIWIYNNERPHQGLGGLTPVQFMLKYGDRHRPSHKQGPITTFQHDSNNDWESIISSVAEMG